MTVFLTRYSHVYDFNPRTREGCDYRGAHKNNHKGQYFNPRTREGCDVIID